MISNNKVYLAIFRADYSAIYTDYNSHKNNVKSEDSNSVSESKDDYTILAITPDKSCNLKQYCIKVNIIGHGLMCAIAPTRESLDNLFNRSFVYCSEYFILPTNPNQFIAETCEFKEFDQTENLTLELTAKRVLYSELQKYGGILPANSITKVSDLLAQVLLCSTTDVSYMFKTIYENEQATKALVDFAGLLQTKIRPNKILCAMGIESDSYMDTTESCFEKLVKLKDLPANAMPVYDSDNPFDTYAVYYGETLYPTGNVVYIDGDDDSPRLPFQFYFYVISPDLSDSDNGYVKVHNYYEILRDIGKVNIEYPPSSLSYNDGVDIIEGRRECQYVDLILDALGIKSTVELNKLIESKSK